MQLEAQPLVSCIMPTANRRRFVPQAIRYFLAQDYPNKELVILDDGADNVADLIPDDPQVRYNRLAGRRSLGAKRNECIQASRGELIMHWDDDDWMAPHRIRCQVEALLQAGAEVGGLRRLLFYELATGQTWLYTYPAGQRPWVVGGTLLYTRAFWRRSPFPAIQIGEDTRFIWNRRLERIAIPTDPYFYVALIHPGNTSPKQCHGSYWSHWSGDLQQIMGEDLKFYQSISPAPPLPHFPTSPASNTIRRPARTGGPLTPSTKRYPEETKMQEQYPTYTIIMVVHNACEMVQMSTLRTLRHSAGQQARLVVVDNGSTDGVEEWLTMLAQRGDIDLICNETNLGHGPGIELARREIHSPYLVALDSDAFPLSDDWLPQLRARLKDQVKIAGIRHHRHYIHPSCLMIARQTLEEFNLSFLAEKDQPSQLDVAERISYEIKRRGYQIAGFERTEAKRRGSVSEPVYLGSEYEGLVYHQWYTTRTVTAAGRPVDDVPSEAIERSLREVFEEYQAESREITVVMGIRARPDEPQRLRNARAALWALNFQDLSRWRYRIVVVEQDSQPRLEAALARLADRYIFAYNPGPYNRSWAFNIGAALAANKTGLLCLIDADLLAPPDFLGRGLAALQSGQRAALPYSEVSYLDIASTEQAIHDRLARPMAGFNVQDYHGRVFTTSQGGCIWVDAKLYHEIGGHDERFRGWGCEDREFWDRLAHATPIARLPGRLLHLSHPQPSMQDQWVVANQRLYQKLASTPSKRKSTRPIGNPNLYAAEDRPAAIETVQPLSGLREWENWHLWAVERIENIVHDERRRTAQTSGRQRLAKLLVKLGHSVLDLGCGPGALWPHLEPYRPRVSWVGVDVTSKMLAAARHLFPRILTSQADAGRLPFSDRSFDVVSLRHVLEYLPPWLMEHVLTEAIRVARRAVVIDFYLTPVAQGARRTTRVGENFLETRWTVTELETPILKAGWSTSERFTLNGAPREVDEIWILRSLQPAANVDRTSETQVLPKPAKFSIIMPTYRRSHTLFRTVQMIRAQTYRNWELIIIDNAGDGGYAFDDPRIRVYCHTAQSSASYARNQGLQYATGDLVCFFDDDDDMFPTYLERLVAAFQASPGAKMVRCGMMVTGNRINYSYATPECCLRREFATPTWSKDGPGQDQRYFRRIVSSNKWSEKKGDIIILREVLCRANADPRGGLRSGKF